MLSRTELSAVSSVGISLFLNELSKQKTDIFVFRQFNHSVKIIPENTNLGLYSKHFLTKNHTVSRDEVNETIGTVIVLFEVKN